MAQDRHEVLVVFEEKEDRDYVKSMGVNIASDKHLGMAIHVPGHLLDNFHALSSVRYNIKAKNMDKGVKRSVKFNDSTMDLFLDICVDRKWNRIYPAEAKEALKDAPTMGVETSRSLTSDDLANLFKGKPASHSNPVVVPDDADQ